MQRTPVNMPHTRGKFEIQYVFLWLEMYEDTILKTLFRHLLGIHTWKARILKMDVGTGWQVQVTSVCKKTKNIFVRS